MLSFLRKHTSLLLAGLLLVLAWQGHWFQEWLPIDQPQEMAILLLLGTAYLWITEQIPLYITSLLVLLLSLTWLLPTIQATGKDVSEDVFYLAFFGDITLLFLGGFVLSAVLNKYGLANRLADWMLRRTGDQPRYVLLGIILISSVLSMWMSNTATAAMMFAIMAPVMQKIPDTSAFAKAISIAIPFACNLGGLGTPIGTPPNAIALDYLNKSGFQLGFAEWMLLSVPLMLVLLFLLWILLQRLFPAGDITLEINEQDSVSFTRRQYYVIAIFALAVLGWLTSGGTGLSAGTVGLLIVIVTFGSGLLATRDFRAISWDILFMLGGGLCLGVGLKASGLTMTLAQMLPLDQGFLVLLLVLLFLAATMTTFMSNTATANLLIPVAVSLPQNPFLFAVAIAIMCSSSMAMPVSTPPNAIAFGSGLIQARDMVRTGVIVTLLALVATLLAELFYFPILSLGQS